MIATHTPKLFNARIKSPAIASRIIGEVPKHLICSKNVKIRKELWAAPNNAAEIKKWRETIAQLSENHDLITSIPDINSPLVKQLLVPLIWRQDQYVSVSPAPSMGLLYELYKRLAEQGIAYRKWVIQPTPAAMSNHGESLLMQGGVVRMLHRGPIDPDLQKSDWKGSFIQLTARCEKINISSGMVSLGFPAITAIGGLVHSVERATGDNIEFAIGFRSIQWSEGVPKTIAHKGSKVGQSGGGKITIGPSYVTDEVTATADVVLLIKTDGSRSKAIKALEKVTRMAGGSLFDVKIEDMYNKKPISASYVFDASDMLKNEIKNLGVDSLQAALELYTPKDGRGSRRWEGFKEKYTLNQVGYAYLEDPTIKECVRGNYPHAWAESTYTLIGQSGMTDKCWWGCDSDQSGVYWKNLDRS